MSFQKYDVVCLCACFWSQKLSLDYRHALSCSNECADMMNNAVYGCHGHVSHHILCITLYHLGDYHVDKQYFRNWHKISHTFVGGDGLSSFLSSTDANRFCKKHFFRAWGSTIFTNVVSIFYILVHSWLGRTWLPNM